MTAVAFRHARFEEDDEFNEWVSSLTGGEPVERGSMVDPTAMQVEMPDIPVAGLSDDGGPDCPPDVQADDTEREYTDASQDGEDACGC
ncbi:hypothetical protein KAT82_08230 [bacterium]|nr:hypothetical protein [bacterium]